MDHVFFELALVMILAGGISVIVSLLKQPSILAYIITGLIIGPLGYYQLHQGEVLQSLSEIGITLLLFTVGLELDITQLRLLGKQVILAGLGQILLTSIAGFGISYLLGFDVVTSTYIGIALTLSSTVLVVKLLSEKHDSTSLYAKLAYGILLIQDLMALLVMVLITAAGSSPDLDGSSLVIIIITTLTKAVVVLSIVLLASKYIFPSIARKLLKSDDLLLIVALAWALGFAALCSLPFIGFGLSIGGFLAGLSLANSALHHQISARIRPLRDFFIILFFIILGSQLQFGNLSTIALPATLLALFVLIGGPLIIMLLLGLLGYKSRTSFMTGLAIGQVSEFSFILISLAYTLGYIDQSIVTLITLSGIISMTVSSYLILHSRGLYKILSPLVAFFDFKDGSAEKFSDHIVLNKHVILVGADRLGRHLLDSLHNQEKHFVVVDHNPEIIESLTRQNIYALCGDITDPQIQELAGVTKATMIISTIPDYHDNLLLIERLRLERNKAKLLMCAQNEFDASNLYKHKVDYVILPYFLGGLHMKNLLENKRPAQLIKQLKQQQIKTLHEHGYST